MENSSNLTKIGQEELLEGRERSKKELELERVRAIKAGYRMKNKIRHEKIKEGSLTDFNLNFITYIFRELGISLRDAALKAGYSPQKVYYWMAADDCLLSQAENLFRGVGIKLVVDTTKKERKVEGENVGITVNVSPRDQRDHYEVKSTRQVLEESIRRGGRMAFIARDIKESGESLSSYARSTKVAATQLKVWIEEDDIKMSRLKSIVNSRGYKLLFSADPLEEKRTEA